MILCKYLPKNKGLKLSDSITLQATGCTKCRGKTYLRINCQVSVDLTFCFYLKLICVASQWRCGAATFRPERWRAGRGRARLARPAPPHPPHPPPSTPHYSISLNCDAVTDAHFSYIFINESMNDFDFFQSTSTERRFFNGCFCFCSF